ncbi:RNA 2',3'-cyclic phosphodiesterase [Lentisphaerota bacterium ZTH]|nr:RNA 2',3'-cyclic phosphodiesterase [Lentisphaerota bacterium]WET07128.1 RNA 2',3'-cyclic phosphodiesterase [Lentisphaerota bacterium ZTH]
MPEKVEHKRLFIAIDLPRPLCDDLSELQSRMPGLKWTVPRQLHLTLAFLGNVAVSDIKPLGSALRTVTLKPFTLCIKDTGFFPDQRRPSIFWLGTNVSPKLQELKDQVDAVVFRQLNLQPGKRAFVPHITLLRFRRPPRPQVVKRLSGLFEKTTGQTINVSCFYLYSSRLSQSGAQHDIEAKFVL